MGCCFTCSAIIGITGQGVIRAFLLGSPVVLHISARISDSTRYQARSKTCISTRILGDINSLNPSRYSVFLLESPMEIITDQGVITAFLLESPNDTNPQWYSIESLLNVSVLSSTSGTVFKQQNCNCSLDRFTYHDPREFSSSSLDNY